MSAAATEKVGSTRRAYRYNDRVVYEWQQSLYEVLIIIKLPPGVGAKQLDVKLTRTDLSVGLKDNPPYLHHAYPHPVREDDSMWTVEDGELHVSLEKAVRGQPWPAAFVGHEVDAHEATEDKKRLMLERFQEENPGFDFSGATFNGEVPDAHTFMRK
jgi:hypothetical protein